MQALHHWLNGDSEASFRQLEERRREYPDDISIVNNQYIIRCRLEDLTSVESTLRQLETIKSPESISNETDADADVALYNQAVLKLELHRFKEAMTLLESLFNRVRDMEEGLAAAVCFALIYGYLSLREPLKCRDAVETLEQQSFAEECPDGTSVDWDRLISSHNSADTVESISDALLGFGCDVHTLTFPLTSALKHPELDTESDTAPYLTEPARTKNLALLLSFYRAKITFLMGQCNTAQKQLTNILQTAPSCIPVLLLKAHVCFQQKLYDQTAEILKHCIQKIPDRSKLRQEVLHNLGSVHFKLGNTHTACLCFSKALSQGLDRPEEESHQTVYNLALLALQQNRYNDALNAFGRAAGTMYLEPSLWIRMAECCLALSTTDRTDETRVIDRVLTKTPVLHTMVIFPTAESPASTDNSTDLWLRKAYAYLQNALALLRNSTASDSPLSDSQEQATMRSIVYMNLAFTTLSLNQPERCLSFIQHFDRIKDAEPDLAFRAKMYEIEALCIMDKTREATERLKNFIDNWPTIREHQEVDVYERVQTLLDDWPSNVDSQICTSDKTDQTEKTMYFNLACVCCADKDFDQAEFYRLKAQRRDPGCPQTYTLGVYIKLAMGEKYEALQLIRGQSL